MYNKELIKFVGISMLVGIVVSGVFISWNEISYKYPEFRQIAGMRIFEIQLMFWPSSFFMMVASARPELMWKILPISIFVNAVIYGGIGLAIWWSLQGHKWVHFLVGGFVVLVWYGILNA